MRKLTADYIFPVSSAPLTQHVLVLDDEGKLQRIDPLTQHDPASVEHLDGVLIPGLINTHCHLELSHLKGKVATGTSLIPFITSVVQFRDVPEEEILDAIDRADAEMYAGGIVAVGDISNKLDTVKRKLASPIRYYTFVEMFDFLQDAGAQGALDQYLPVYEGQAQGNGNQRTAVPHAPYSVSKRLFHEINQLNQGRGTVSIHNQETPPENELFLHKTGAFLDFYGGFQIPLDNFEATGQTAIHYALANMDPSCRHLFVHNTLSTPADIAAATAWGQNGMYWATCANANLYIENRLPNYQYWLDADAKMTIGTDSLTSNWQLSVLEEMRTIHRYQSYVPFETLLRWATLNGAEALQFDADLGSLEVGKTPGVNLLTGLAGSGPDNFKVGKATEIRRVG
ncbi:MAG: amidohydrolase family protein [Bacteroidota bacterium]